MIKKIARNAFVLKYEIVSYVRESMIAYVYQHFRVLSVADRMTKFVFSGE